MSHYELREYQMKLSASADYIKSFEAVGLPMLRAAGFDLVGAWTTEIGARSGSTFAWLLRWEDMNQRAEAFQRFRAQPGYPAFVRENAERIVSVENRILRALPFSPAS